MILVSVVNTTGEYLLGRMVVANASQARLGIGGALLVLPLIACGTYGLLAFVPFLGALRIGKILENSTDYSLRTPRGMRGFFRPAGTAVRV